MKRPTLVKSSKVIRKLLKERFEDLELRSTAITEDANNRGMKFTIAMLSKYLNHDNPEGGLSDDGILWLCFRYGINVHLLVGYPVVDKKTKEISLDLTPKDESWSFKKLDEFFPNLKKINGKK